MFKSAFMTFAMLLAAPFSYGAIECSGYQVDAEDQQIYVSVDDNPLKIFTKILTEDNAGLSLSVRVLEDKNIMAETESEMNQTRVDLQINPGGLPQGYNAKLVLRKLSLYNPIPLSKTIYVLKCSGKLPEDYR